MNEAAFSERVRRFFREHYPEAAGTTLVAAVSGGPDSVCLLHILHALQSDIGYTLHVAHLNHALRGEASDADADYVQEMAGKLGLTVSIERRDAAAFQKEHRLSPEEAAREVRYVFLAETARETGAAAVATGHTADDQAETVLLNLMRGTGTRGLRGLQYVSARRVAGEELTIIRPILDFTREETAAYCREHDLATRLDESNLSTEPKRNRVRHELIPALRSYNPSIVEALLRTARIAGEDIAFIDSEAANAFQRCAVPEGESVRIDKAAFNELPAALRRYVLRECVKRVRGTLKDIEAGHIETALAALDKPAGRSIGLPDGLSVSIEYESYVVAKDTAAACPLPVISGEQVITVPGTTKLPGWDITAVLEASGGEVSHEDAWTAWFDYDTTGGELRVRTRQPGDRFRPLGMAAEKKLNRFMMDEHIPRGWRGRVPLVCDAEGILWVAGWRISDRARVTEATRQTLRLTFRRV